MNGHPFVTVRPGTTSKAPAVVSATRRPPMEYRRRLEVVALALAVSRRLGPLS